MIEVFCSVEVGTAVAGVIGADPEQVDAFAHRLADVADRIDDIRGTLTSQISRTYWDGPEGVEFRDDWKRHHARILASTSVALRAASTDARRDAEHQRGVSQAEKGVGGIAVSGAAPGSQGQVQQLWDSLTPAQQGQLQQMGISPLGVWDGFVWLLQRVGLAPKDASALNLVGWLAGLGGLAAGLLIEKNSILKYGTFKKHFPTGFLARFWAGFNLKQQRGAWWPKGGPFRTEYLKWESTGKLVTRAGAAITGVVAGWQQWNEDAGKGLDTASQAARATIMGSATAGGALAGAVFGAKVGAGIGTLFGPGPGTAIGAAVGAFAGGIGGAILGENVGDAIIGPAENWLGGAGDAIASGVGKLKFW